MYLFFSYKPTEAYVYHWSRELCFCWSFGATPADAQRNEWVIVALIICDDIVASIKSIKADYVRY